MKWHNFEIRKRNENGQYELVFWATKDGCFAIALIDYDYESRGFNIKSVGLRLFQYWEQGLEEYVLRYLDLLQLQYEDD